MSPSRSENRRALTAIDAGRSDSRRYRKLKLEFRAECVATKAPCWLCNRPIDYLVGYPHPDSLSRGHAKTVVDHPELADDRANFQPAHLDCIKRRGTDDPHVNLGDPSEIW
ncbi:hypothetical protein [Mycobacterium sp. shizuoka-1]|uniref:hypothetical protein n=1 Tax=Mycobacterium sp. shizuoka-1 TaxID=2039281 RepID=UPI000C05E696|nr:hypothetical protein [Mycobacterium sp. shizuoka-1]GAY16233.1 hypothetical protein MSZK_29590 [Mycobacterium sp. shizuoka-1]